MAPMSKWFKQLSSAHLSFFPQVRSAYQDQRVTPETPVPQVSKVFPVALTEVATLVEVVTKAKKVTGNTYRFVKISIALLQLWHVKLKLPFPRQVTPASRVEMACPANKDIQARKESSEFPETWWLGEVGSQETRATQGLVDQLVSRDCGENSFSQNIWVQVPVNWWRE